MSCEPQEVFEQQFIPAPKDTAYVSGMNMRLFLNGATVNYSSAGYGIACTDSSGETTWAAITGNAVIFDPATNTYSTAPNDTSLVLVFYSQNMGVGTYTIPSFEDAFCVLDGPDNSNIAFRQYDPSQLVVNITRVTTDSIFGNYSGALPEVIDFTIGPLGNVIPVYSGVIDSVSTVFGVRRNPC